MSAIASHIDNSSSTARKAVEGRRYFHAPNGWKGPLLFMLSMAAVGLCFYPAWLVVIAMMLHRFKTDRYEALIMLIIALGGYGFREGPTTIECCIIFAVATPLLFLLKKTSVTKKTVIIWGIYALGCLFFALKSLESLPGQAMMLMWYLSFIFFLIPLWMFAGTSFSMEDFFNRLYPFAIIYCVFYCIDGLILKGPVFLPAIQPFIGAHPFWSLYMAPFSTHPVRIYPPGFYLGLMLIYPLVRTHKLHWWEWVLIIVALIITKTFSLMSAVLLGFIICQKGFSKTSRYLVLGAGLLTVTYAVDISISDLSDLTSGDGSKLRVASTINQFVLFDSAQDAEDLAEFGTGRMAQVIPKVEYLYDMGLEWTGFGFLHPFKSDNPVFMITNDLYSDIEQSEESVAAVEVIPVQVFLNMGYLGVIWHTLFLLGLVLVIRKLPDAKYFWTLMAIFIWLGIAGFCGMVQVQGQMVVSTAFAMVILQDKTRRGINCKESPTPFRRN